MSGALLLVSSGQTDLQLAAELDEGGRRVQFGKDESRWVHEWLLGGDGRYEVDARANPPEARGWSVGWQAVDGRPQLVSNSDATPLSPPLRLFPAKLAGIDAAVRDVGVPDTVVVFNTRRDTRPGEPVACGPILSRWLAGLFGLAWDDQEGVIGRGWSGWIDYLTGRMRLESEDGEGIDGEAVARIDSSLLRLGGDFDRVYLALGGGMPAIREQIRSVARFRFPHARLFECRNPERSLSLVEAPRPHFLPSDSFRARQHARDLVRAGDFAAAYAVARPLAERPTDLSWIVPLEWAARYFDGLLGRFDDLPSFLQAIVPGAGAPRCLHAAMRAEAALRSGRLPEAILWTLSFRDAAVIDYIARLPFVSHIDVIRRQLICWPKQTPPESVLSKPADNPACGPAREGKGRYQYYTGKYNDFVWFDAIGPAAAPLRQLTQLLRAKAPEKATLPLVETRNILAHGALEPQDLRNAAGAFVRAGIWSERGEPVRFLGRDVTIAVLSGLGVADPVALYEGLVAGLVALMESPFPPDP